MCGCVGVRPRRELKRLQGVQKTHREKSKCLVTTDITFKLIYALYTINQL